MRTATLEAHVYSCKMSEAGGHELDSEQVKKAVQALLAYQKKKEDGNVLLLNEHDRISLMLTVWRIPSREQTIRIPLPHAIRPEACDVCLFTRDEPNMTSEQTEKFYKKLLSQHGIKQISEVISLNRLKKEYKPYEAKRRLLASFDLFLSDDRIRRFLPSLLGKHFYKAKREPQSVNLKSKYLAALLNRFIQGTQLHINNKGCCYSIRVGHTDMKVDDIVENAVAVAKVLAEKLPMKWKSVKVLHLKTQTSVALPVFNSPLSNIHEINLLLKKNKKKKQRKSDKKAKSVSPGSGVTSDASATVQEESEASFAEINEPDDVEEEIPQLIPIQLPTKEEEEIKTISSSKKKTPKVQAKENTNVTKENVILTPKAAGQKRRVSTKKGDILETPTKQKKVQTPKRDRGQETKPEGDVIKKTPKAVSKPTIKLSKSAKKAPQTPKLKQKKKMKIPQSA
ncbi:ribosomal L1 domain-containing protein 1 isoform X1 [Xenopus laevis]|uniref:Ribosomal L1 domain-containing protein 1 n=1 Tax=Xenopus laevis TaxID=8355 RepID=A0A8J0U152_XENLA|nr:ribosomal L1 domain-containing protein 1 isoform X1 [Xenopus laevis]